MNHKKCCLIISTTPNMQNAKYIAKKLLKNKLVSCISIIPKIYSLYYWNNILEEKKEVQIIAKTLLFLKNKVFSAIKKYHTYNVPELICLKTSKIDESYLLWIKNQIKLKT